MVKRAWTVIVEVSQEVRECGVVTDKERVGGNYMSIFESAMQRP